MTQKCPKRSMKSASSCTDRHTHSYVCPVYGTHTHTLTHIQAHAHTNTHTHTFTYVCTKTTLLKSLYSLRIDKFHQHFLCALIMHERILTISQTYKIIRDLWFFGLNQKVHFGMEGYFQANITKK